VCTVGFFTDGTKGRPRKHGGKLALTDPGMWPVLVIAVIAPRATRSHACANKWSECAVFRSVVRTPTARPAPNSGKDSKVPVGTEHRLSGN
jgi:hypothetical protein